ncbi:hypothetical protein VIGAN_04092800, partial [Vigna angularis var. angularis]
NLKLNFENILEENKNLKLNFENTFEENKDLKNKVLIFEKGKFTSSNECASCVNYKKLLDETTSGECSKNNENKVVKNKYVPRIKNKHNHRTRRTWVEKGTTYRNTNVVSCFYCMKKGHTSNKCKIKHYGVPSGRYVWVIK